MVLADRAQTANRKRMGSNCGRSPSFDRQAYTQRNTVERCVKRHKNRRGPATRYEKPATVLQAGLHIAALFIWSAS
ncbi:hypothetical protein ACIP2X_06545 [Streptomyces sp. NPDC089424]|uniref:hypothetical protein n=1 Tax=Streptomyces sp. NPDC089424 TaxID=3365917 RepID=UPI0037F9A9E7